MPELLLELLSEEIPARMQRRAIDDLTGLLREKLTEAEIPAADLRGYVTPRRLAIIAEGIPSTQPDRAEERRGPRVGASPQALDGFLRSVGLGSVEDCEVRNTGRGEFYFAVIKRSGRPAAEVLPDLIKAAIVELSWPKSMRWPASPLRWVRPLTSVICVYDGKVLPLALEGVPVGRTTRGHRFLSPGEICVGGAAEYAEKLQHAYVIVDQDQRRQLIHADLDRRTLELGIKVKPDPGLLDEVTGLAEYPVVLAGAIDTDFMTLPPEVLQTAMRVHQKYFSCIFSDGRPAPHFLFVANNLAVDGGKAIIAGNERVLRARLADARFFWDQDRKIRLDEWLEQLRGRVYHAQLGNLFDKAERLELLAEFLVEHVPGSARQRAQRAALLSKTDLSTAMVGEFPELQGVMGGYYARHPSDMRYSEDPRVAEAIAEHYKPLGPNDACPGAPESIVVALADKIDTIFGFFWINEKPSGSRDPFALRRAAQGIIRIILENGLRLPLVRAFKYAQRVFIRHQNEAHSFTGRWRYLGVGPFVSDISDEAMEFIADRLKVHLRDRGIRRDLISAVFALGEDDLVRLLARVDALAGFLSSNEGANLLTAYRRASNIVAIEERRDDRSYIEGVNPALFRQPEEVALFADLNLVAAGTKLSLKTEDFESAMGHLATMRPSVDNFFDKVTVNVDEPELRENRLRLLARIRATMNRVADFSQIQERPEDERRAA